MVLLKYSTATVSGVHVFDDLASARAKQAEIGGELFVPLHGVDDRRDAGGAADAIRRAQGSTDLETLRRAVSLAVDLLDQRPTAVIVEEDGTAPSASFGDPRRFFRKNPGIPSR